MMTPEVVMRLPIRVVLGLGTLLVLTAASAPAQSWNATTQDLRTACERAGGATAFPGADAVVVFDRREVEVEPSGLSRTVQHTLRMALTAAGACDLAVELLPYDPMSADVQVLRCRVLTADGAVRDVDPKAVIDAPDPQNLIYWNSRHKCVPVGRLDPGDAVELVARRVGFTYALLVDGEAGPDESRFVPPMKGHFYDIVPFWSTWPVVEQSYRVTVPADKELQYQFYDGAAEVSSRLADGRRVVTVTMRGFKPLEKEPGMVALSDVAPKLILTTAADWKAKSVWFHDVQEKASCFAVTPELQALASRITAGLTTDEDKVAALNHWAAENIRYVGLHMGTGEGYTLHPAAMTLRDRGGVCKDKAGILVALLRAAGFESYPAMTMAGERIERIAADQFNHCVTVWRKPDKTTVLLDPTWIPGVREMWSSREQQQEVLMGLPEGADLLTTPVSPPEDHPLAVSVRSTLAADGTLSGTMRVTADGQSDAALRRLYRGRLRNEWPALDSAMLTSVDARAEVVRATRSDLDDTRAPFAMEIGFHIPGYARVLDDGSLLLTPLAARHPVGQAAHADEVALALKPADRRYPVRIGCSKLLTLTERMTLPPGATVKGLPDAVKLEGSGRLAASWKVSAGELVVEETLALSKRIFTPEEWPSLRGALEAFRTLSETPVLITVARHGKERA
jgi:transglutaminase-like putative cysteine protease